MGNQARVKSKATVFSTSTRNFDNRIGDGAQVFLGSAELAAVTALKAKLPTPSEYFEIVKEKVLTKPDKIYRYLTFDKMPGFSIDY
jgi:aconitate hydratase 2/2-methylisocitrate dehydratase